MSKHKEEQLAELSKRMTAINRSIHLAECNLNSLKWQYENVAKQYWEIRKKPDPQLYKRYLFFKENAGYCVGRRAAGALALARAERWAADEGLEFVWEFDPDCSPDDFDFERDKEHVREHGAVMCALVRPCQEHGAECDHAESLASLCGITESLNNRERDNYRKVVEAELALEAME